jgi:hypothetical protein
MCWRLKWWVWRAGGRSWAAGRRTERGLPCRCQWRIRRGDIQFADGARGSAHADVWSPGGQVDTLPLMERFSICVARCGAGRDRGRGGRGRWADGRGLLRASPGRRRGYPGRRWGGGGRGGHLCLLAGCLYPRRRGAEGLEEWVLKDVSNGVAAHEAGDHAPCAVADVLRVDELRVCGGCVDGRVGAFRAAPVVAVLVLGRGRPAHKPCVEGVEAAP